MTVSLAEALAPLSHFVKHYHIEIRTNRRGDTCVVGCVTVTEDADTRAIGLVVDAVLTTLEEQMEERTLAFAAQLGPGRRCWRYQCEVECA
jgi:hypothetical protein